MKVGYLGPRGSFTYSAAVNFFKEETLLPYESLTAKRGFGLLCGANRKYD
jgi:prephenate dehydratase